MKKLILLFGLFAIVGSFNLVQASVVTNDVIELYDCDKCQNHECDQACKKEGCTARKLAVKIMRHVKRVKPKHVVKKTRVQWLQKQKLNLAAKKERILLVLKRKKLNRRSNKLSTAYDFEELYDNVELFLC